MQRSSSSTRLDRYRNTPVNLRIIGVDDGSIKSGEAKRKTTPILGVLVRNFQILNVRVRLIEVDGRDVNRRLASMLKSVRFDLVLLSGISFGGFNLVDLEDLAHATRRPVIAVTADQPNNMKVKAALRAHFPDWKERWRIVQRAGPIHSVKPPGDQAPVYFEVKGMAPRFAAKIIRGTCKLSRLPEPVRAARILARSLSGVL